MERMSKNSQTYFKPTTVVFNPAYTLESPRELSAIPGAQATLQPKKNLSEWNQGIEFLTTQTQAEEPLL